ncbi:hypothetical protein GN278_02155 [Rhodobacteraceae bacterium Araon29]
MTGKKMKFILLSLLLLGTPAVAKTGAVLKDMCKSGNAAQPNELGAGFCLGAIASILEVMKAGNSIGGMNACFPADLSTSDAIDTVLQYLDKSKGAELDLNKYMIHSALAVIFMLEFKCD